MMSHEGGRWPILAALLWISIATATGWFSGHLGLLKRGCVKSTFNLWNSQWSSNPLLKTFHFGASFYVHHVSPHILTSICFRSCSNEWPISRPRASRHALLPHDWRTPVSFRPTNSGPWRTAAVFPGQGGRHHQYWCYWARGDIGIGNDVLRFRWVGRKATMTWLYWCHWSDDTIGVIDKTVVSIT